MNYYKDTNGNVFAYSDIQIPKTGLVKMTEQEVQDHINNPPVVNITQITIAQGQAILAQKGKYQDVVDYITAITDPTQKLLAQIAFDKTNTWSITSPFLVQAATDLGFINDLQSWFNEAASIEL